MITIKELTEQEYEKTINKPTEIVFFYRHENIEKQFIGTVYFHLAENIKEMIEYLKQISKFNFTDKEYIILQTEKKSVTIYFIEVEITPVPIQCDEKILKELKESAG